MSKTLTQDTLRVDYYRYKSFIVPIVVLIVCVLLFFNIIIPQLQSWFALQGQISDTRAKVQSLSSDISMLSAVNDTDLDTQMKTVVKALPVSKDLLSMLSALNSAGVNSGVSIGDYSVQSTATGTSNNQTVQVTITVNGTISAVEKFITVLKNQLPLADVVDIRMSNSSATLTIGFYYKPVPKIAFDESEKIQGLSPSEVGLINTLSTLSANTTDSIDLPQFTNDVPQQPSSNQ